VLGRAGAVVGVWAAKGNPDARHRTSQAGDEQRSERLLRKREVQTMTIPTLPLNDGRAMPQIGLGTASLKDDQIAPVVVAAIEAGYRHVDTAYRYGNQRGVGRGIRESGVDRAELFVTTKLDGEFQGDDRAIAGLDECLRQLELD
jgi:2,5-diketo-D-gluconate reductase A